MQEKIQLIFRKLQGQGRGENQHERSCGTELCFLLAKIYPIFQIPEDPLRWSNSYKTKRVTNVRENAPQ